MITLDLSQEWRIAAAGPSDPVFDLAVTELRAALEKITGVSPLVTARQREGLRGIVLTHRGGATDGFRWQARADLVTIDGDGPRGLLFGVYAFLEALGCRWVSPGPQGERLPAGPTFTLPEEPVEERPALAGRSLIVGHHAFLKDGPAWVEWAARNRLNTVFFHTIEEPLALGAAHESEYLAARAALVRTARQRGMVIEHGGHGLAALLPRRLFRRLPEAFREQNGRRTPDHNFCPTSEAGLAVIRQNAAAHFRARPEVDVFHLWPDDIVGGGWCSCDRCRAYTASEQALLAVNAIAEVLEGINPAAQISFLAYHDTEDVPARVTPRPNVHMLWAPRMRCYAQPIDSPDSPVNHPRYPATFRAQVAHFQAAGARPARVFEYYLDGILFKSVLPPLPTVMKADLRFYRDAGAHTVGALMTGTREWSAPQLNAWLFARLSWNPDQDLLALVVDFCRAAFGSDSPDLPALYRALEQAFALALDMVPQQIRLEFEPGRPLQQPPVDMGDPFYAPPEVLRQRAARSPEIERLAAQARALLDRAHNDWAARQPPGPPSAEGLAWWHLMDEMTLVEHWLGFDAARVRLYDALSSTPPQPGTMHHLSEAERHLGAVLEWAGRIEDRRLRDNMRLIHLAMWGLRLVRVRLDHFTRGPAALWLRLRTLLRLARLMARLRGAYVQRGRQGGQPARTRGA
ncbi:MAG: DUF4838 domain-containing protein [Anaerolineae bacterium]